MTQMRSPGIGHNGGPPLDDDGRLLPRSPWLLSASIAALLVGMPIDVSHAAATPACEATVCEIAPKPRATTIDALLMVTSLSGFMAGGSGVTPSIEFFLAGGGGGGWNAGGGGAGRVRTGTLAVTPGVSNTVTIGSGGAVGTVGSDSVFASITAEGGGRGGTPNGTGGNQDGGPGGQGGGAGYASGGPGGAAGDGIDFDGGAYPSYAGYAGGGGGGASQVGGAAVHPHGGKGGDGVTSSMSGSSDDYAGGGGGGADTGAGGTPGAGGLGGGGTGGTAAGAAPTAGAANKGAGGGGGFNSGGGKAGGSGIGIFRYPDIYPAPTSVTGSPTTLVSGGYRIFIFTGSGSITI